MIKALILDVDGVLTDGKIIYSADGVETKNFHVRDGLGIKLIQSSGVEVIIISGRPSKVTELRAAELGIKHVFTGIKDKLAVLNELCGTIGLALSECAAIGDDINDLPVLKAVGISATVGDAASYVKDNVDFVCSLAGGSGAVREFIDHIIMRDGHWEKTLSTYLSC